MLNDRAHPRKADQSPEPSQNQNRGISLGVLSATQHRLKKATSKSGSTPPGYDYPSNLKTTPMHITIQQDVDVQMESIESSDNDGKSETFTYSGGTTDRKVVAPWGDPSPVTPDSEYSKRY